MHELTTCLTESMHANTRLQPEQLKPNENNSPIGRFRAGSGIPPPLHAVSLYVAPNHLPAHPIDNYGALRVTR